MDNSRSSSVPLLHTDDDDDASCNKLTRSSFSLSSIQPIHDSPLHMPMLWNDGIDTDIELDDDDDTEEEDDVSSDDETSIAIPGRKAKNPTITSSTSSSTSSLDEPMDLSSDILYDDIWMDTPVFHEYLQSLETWLYQYLSWLEKIEQCRQLEIAYSKSIALLYDQTKLMLSEPFYTAEECSNLNWPDDESSINDEEVWDNEDVRSILPFLRDHGSKIKETLLHFENTLTTTRKRYIQLSNNYCAAQKLRSQTNYKSLDEISMSLYVSKKALCKVLLEYIYALNNLIRSTRNLVNEKLGPLFQGLQSDKNRNLKSLQDLVLIATDFIYDVKKSTDSESRNSVSSSTRISDEYHELNNERLSYYIHDKLASYYNCLKNTIKSQNDPLNRCRPSSPNSIIPFTFLNKPRSVQRYNSLDSLLSSSNLKSFLPTTQMVAKGYLLIKKKVHVTTCNPNNTANSNVNQNSGKWERHYFFISKEDGNLRQYQDQMNTLIIMNLKTVIIRASESDKRDYVILATSNGTNNTISLQAETSIDFSNWLQALKSWNPENKKSSTSITTSITHSPSTLSSPSRKSEISALRTSSNQNKSFLNKRPSFNTSTTNEQLLRKYDQRNHHASHFINNGEVITKESVVGYPIPISDCPISCCSSNGLAGPKIQMTGLFRIHKSCINKLSCISHHFGTLCVLYVSLFENGILHLQTEKDDQTFFHRPIQLSQLQPQDIYPFSDSIDHMKYCIVIRASTSETYHLMTCSKVQRDAWLVRLKKNTMLTKSTVVRKINSLNIRISEGRKFQVHHKDSIHSEMYCDIVLDNEIRGLTGCLKKTSNLFWREDFSFPDITRMKHGVTITIYSRSSKTDRETVYGSLFLPVNQIIKSSNTIQEEWYEIRKENRHRAFASLTGLGSNNQSLGQLRVGISLEEHLVFPISVYQPLMEVLIEFRHEMIYDMARRTSDVQTLAKNLLRIYEGIGMTFSWIKSMIDYEVAALTSDDVNILFRGNSFFTKVIDNYMKMSGREFLEEALQFTIQKICKFSLHIEVESSRLPNNNNEANLTASCSELFNHVRSIWGGIQRAKTKCPVELRRVFGHLQSAIVQKFDLGKDTLDRHHQVARYTCVSGFIFLRWICPAIISPKQFGLVQDYPDTKTCRTLTLIAKCLMTLASHSTIEQNAKEPWMVRLNEFVQNNTHHFINFINFVSQVDDKADTSQNSIRSNPDEIVAPYFIDLELELSQFTSWCVNECQQDNIITRTCQSIERENIL